MTSKGVSKSNRGSSLVDLNRFLNHSLRVKFSGGRELTGRLKGYDSLLNLVLDEAKEWRRDPFDPERITETQRHIGLCVCRGTAVVLICPTEGMEEISNPFHTQQQQQQHQEAAMT